MKIRSGAAASIAAALVVTSVLLVSGCATQPTPASPAPRLKPRPVVDSFSVSGRIAARVGNVTDDAAKKGFSGGFSWKHDRGDDVVELLTPLGQIAARATMTPSGATIELADGQRATTTEPEAFIGRVLGVTLPIRSLPYWMQAAPVPSPASSTSSTINAEPDAAGRLATLWQHGWQIRYTGYSSESLDAHPTRIELAQGDVEAKILIDEWKAP
jgi:outer membrane lipoprotein LolB